MAKKIGRKLLSPFLGKQRYQKSFEFLYNISLAGMNFGEGVNPIASGEIHAMNFVKKELTRRGHNSIIIFDIGANVGKYTIDIVKTFGENVSIYAFEPSPSTFKMLSQNLRHLKDSKLYNIGFGNEEGIFTLYTAGQGSKLASFYQLDHVHDASNKYEETAQLTTVDKFCKKENLNHISLIKIDVEGYEFKVLQGAQSMLDSGAIEFIQFEFSKWNVETKLFFKDFYSLLNEKYDIYRLLKDGLKAIKEYKETHEIFKKATNYLAIRKHLEQ